ncbi:MAG: hypothetical protein WAO78_13280, partial [Roseovarius sp.]
SLMLFQNPNDLFFAETASLHLLSPQLENRLTLNAGHFRGAGHVQCEVQCIRHALSPHVGAELP